MTYYLDLKKMIPKDASSFAGALTFGDAHLLCFPVRSLVGTFAWATCPFILARYARDAKAFLNGFALEIPKLTGKQALVTKESKLVHESKVILEDLDLDKQDGADDWATHIATAIFADAESIEKSSFSRKRESTTLSFGYPLSWV